MMQMYDHDHGGILVFAAAATQYELSIMML